MLQDKQTFDEHLNTFKTISLEKAMSVNLNERYDMKFVTPLSLINPLFSSLKENFLVQELNGMFFQPYQTLYFDTPELLFFHQHASGKTKRIKIRKRFYKETDVCQLEIKAKEKNITKKFRNKSIMNDFFSEQDSFFLDHHGIKAAELQPVLHVAYKRLVLWDKNMSGRITIDKEYSSGISSPDHQFDKMAIIEIKGSMPFINQVVRSTNLPLYRYQTPFSKYAIGMIECCQIPKKQSRLLLDPFINFKKTYDKCLLDY